jgi:hypothetical protein
MSSSETSVGEFVAAAREYCRWLELEPRDSETELFTALVLLSKLYASALTLPDVDPESLPPLEQRDDALASAREEKVIARLDGFPTRFYWRLDGHVGNGGDKVEDDLARDLFLTYAAVRPHLDDFDSRMDRRGGAIWSWRYSFWGDWGRHSSNAIQVLHKYFHDKAWSDDE